jgi:hypothetical protein
MKTVRKSTQWQRIMLHVRTVTLQLKARSMQPMQLMQRKLPLQQYLQKCNSWMTEAQKNQHDDAGFLFGV